MKIKCVKTANKVPIRIRHLMKHGNARCWQGALWARPEWALPWLWKWERRGVSPWLENCACGWPAQKNPRESSLSHPKRDQSTENMQLDIEEHSDQCCERMRSQHELFMSHEGIEGSQHPLLALSLLERRSVTRLSMLK